MAAMLLHECPPEEAVSTASVSAGDASRPPSGGWGGSTKVSPPRVETIQFPQRLLLGPGPTNFPPEVLRALSLPPLGYLDPHFLQVLLDVQGLLRYCFQTENDVTLAISGTGSAAMEAALANLIEDGDRVLVAINGYFGLRLQEMARRYGADVRVISKPWGSIFSMEDLRAALEQHRPALLCIVMAETSTGALQPLEGLGCLCHELDCLLLVDAVTGLCTSPLYVDQWSIDACYSCSQKGLSCCPGASPLTMSPRAMEKVAARKTPVKNWYLDLSLLLRYWGLPNEPAPRVYHHTPPMNVLYGLRESLRLIAAEGLEAVWLRHRDVAQYLTQQLEGRGLRMHVQQERYRSPALSTVVVPPHLDAAAVCRSLLADGVEVGAGIGELAGKIWRVGLMGNNAKRENVDTLVRLLCKHLPLNSK
ncbi:hypothetical protein ACSSS7_002744 [Eimeria intestinalis]